MRITASVIFALMRTARVCVCVCVCVCIVVAFTLHFRFVPQYSEEHNRPASIIYGLFPRVVGLPVLESKCTRTEYQPCRVYLRPGISVHHWWTDIVLGADFDDNKITGQSSA